MPYCGAVLCPYAALPESTAIQTEPRIILEVFSNLVHIELNGVPLCEVNYRPTSREVVHNVGLGVFFGVWVFDVYPASGQGLGAFFYADFAVLGHELAAYVGLRLVLLPHLYDVFV